MGRGSLAFQICELMYFHIVPQIFLLLLFLLCSGTLMVYIIQHLLLYNRFRVFCSVFLFNHPFWSLCFSLDTFCWWVFRFIDPFLFCAQYSVHPFNKFLTYDIPFLILALTCGSFFIAFMYMLSFPFFTHCSFSHWILQHFTIIILKSDHSNIQAISGVASIDCSCLDFGLHFPDFLCSCNTQRTLNIEVMFAFIKAHCCFSSFYESGAKSI